MLANTQLSSSGKETHELQLAYRGGSQTFSSTNIVAAKTSNTRKKFARASNQKSKTGCRTCKIRRLKCDEARPHCLRCIKFGMTCDGYPSDSPSFAPARPRGLQKGMVSVELYVPPVWSLPQTGRFTSAHESQLFTLYVEETAPQISGPFQTSLWARLIPQACEAEPFLPQLIIATSALSYVCTEEFSEHGDMWAANRRSTYSYALTQYGKALRSMRKAINNGNYNLRNALLARLLVYCFESLHGDAKSTAKHAASGLALLSEFISQHTISKALAVPRTGRFEGLDVEILHAFANLDVQVPAGMGGAHVRSLKQFTDTIRTQIWLER